MRQRHLLICKGLRCRPPKKALRLGIILARLLVYLAGAGCKAIGKVLGSLLLLSVGGPAIRELVSPTYQAHLILLCPTEVLCTGIQGELDLRARKVHKALGIRLVGRPCSAGTGGKIACPGQNTLVEATVELQMRLAKEFSAIDRPAETVRQTAIYLVAMRNIFAQNAHQATTIGVEMSSSDRCRKRCRQIMTLT